MQSIKTFIKNAFTALFVDRRASKRLSRLEYQDLVAVVVLLWVIVRIVIVNYREMTATRAFIILFWTILSIVLLIKLGIRRSKDLNESPWLIFSLIIPILNIYYILHLLFAKGSLGDNRYGPDPRGNYTKQSLMIWICGVAQIAILVAAVNLCIIDTYPIGSIIETSYLSPWPSHSRYSSIGNQGCFVSELGLPTCDHSRYYKTPRTLVIKDISLGQGQPKINIEYHQGRNIPRNRGYVFY